MAAIMSSRAKRGIGTVSSRVKRGICTVSSRVKRGICTSIKCSSLAALGMTARLPAQNAEADAYTRYELLAPGSAKFKIIYEVTAVSPGVTWYFNPIRKGSIATDESVFDRATGKPLQFDVVGSAVAQAGGVRNRDTSQTYIRVKLARPVPADGGEA